MGDVRRSLASPSVTMASVRALLRAVCGTSCVVGSDCAQYVDWTIVAGEQLGYLSVLILDKCCDIADAGNLGSTQSGASGSPSMATAATKEISASVSW